MEALKDQLKKDESKRGLLVPINDPIREFDNHVNIPDNYRVMFSGPFGVGKTTFLREYFGGVKNFQPIYLYPVNYSVSDNRDVFELVKFDILFELLGVINDFDQTIYSDSEFLNVFVAENFVDIQKLIIDGVAAVTGKPIEVLGKALGLVEKFKSGKSSINDLADDKKTLLGYLNKVKETKGTAYEMNFISELILKLVEQFEVENPKKKLVLIIDDLDRLDPDHIFRILNVFSAHFDSRDPKGKENKFGFEKIIFVGDINNIEGIFRHKYGSDTDFNGYMDKFFSSRVFKFDNSEAAVVAVRKVLSNFYNTNKSSTIALLESQNSPFSSFLNYTIQGLIQSGVLSLRRLLSVNGVESDFEFFKVDFSQFHNGRRNDLINTQYPATMLIEFLKLVFGSKEALLRGLKSNTLFDHKLIKDGKDNRNILKSEILIFFNEIDSHRVNEGKSYTFEFSSGRVVNYNLYGHIDGQVSIIDTKDSSTDAIERINEKDYFDLLYHTALTMNRKKWLR